jgi:hypothetical protein
MNSNNEFDDTYLTDNIFCSNSSPILELSVKFESQICHENIKKPLDGTYLADFGIDISCKLHKLLAVR